MTIDSLWGLLAVPIGLGLLGFVEPCSVGTSLLFLQYLEGRPAAVQVTQTVAFTLVRALFVGLLGAVAAWIGSAFVGFQKGAWIVMGVLYVMLGAVYLSGRADRLKHSFGASLGRLSTTKGAAALGALFALNIPACAAPLLGALLGSAAVVGANRMAQGFVMLSAFGLALSLPIAVAVAVAWPAGRRLLDRLGGLSATVPKIIGIVFIVLGAWSIRFAFVAEI